MSQSSPPTRTVAHALLESLTAAGVSHVFGLPGSTEAPLLAALDEPDQPRYVLGLHETVVVSMADGYARGSGGLGVVSLHTSVGTGNAVSQMRNAAIDRSPVLALIGHKDSRLANRDGFCTVEDLPGMLRADTTWSREVHNAEQAVEDLQRAVRHALGVPSGPAALVITEDRAAAADRGPPAPAWRSAVTSLPSRFRPPQRELASLLERLHRAARPVIVAGDEVARDGAGETLGRLAEVLGCVVVNEPRRSATRQACSTEHDAYAGEYAPHHPAVETADVLLAVGGRMLVEFEPAAEPEVPAGVYFAHVHESPRELGKRYQPDLPLIGSAGETVAALLELAEGATPPSADTLAHVREQRRRYLEWRTGPPIQGGDEQPLTMTTVATLLDRELPSDVVVVDEAIRAARTLMRHLRLPTGRDYHRSTGGAIGWGLPAAIGLQLAVGTERRVAGVIGDGSALMSIQALWTAAHNAIPVLVYVLNNRSYHAVQVAVGKHRGDAAGGADAHGSRITDPDPDFVGLATSLGVEAVRAATPNQFVKATHRALESARPTVVEVMLRPNEA